MKGRGKYFAATIVLAAVLMFAFASTALAELAWDNVATSAGEGNALGNQAPDTSPEPSAWWFNHAFTVEGLYVYDANDSATHYAISGGSYVRNTGAPVDFTGSTLQVTDQGLYAISATEVVSINNVPTTLTGTAFFGLDKTDPISTSNAAPIYQTSAAITINATDALSGAEYISYKLDGGPFLQAPDEFGVVSALVNTSVPGVHTLTWFALDNAGNTDSHMVSFTVLASDYVPVLSKPKVATRPRHKFNFKGSVTAAASDKVVKVEVQRKSRGAFRPYATFSVPVAKYVGSYSFTAFVRRHSTFRVRATQGTGASGWTGFKSK